MENRKKFSRKDFLKLGGLAAISLPTMTKVGQLGTDSLVRSEEAYGGFLVRQLGKGEDPIITNGKFKRIHAKDVIFSRMIHDEEFISRLDEVETIYEAGDQGYGHLDVALGGAAAFCAGYDNSNTPMLGLHAGLIGLNPSSLTKDSVHFEGKWDHSIHSPEEVNEIVKKAAKFLGASLVGVAPFDERFIYSGYYDALGGCGAGPIEITEVIIPELPEGKLSREEAGDLIKETLSAWEPNDIKTFIIEVLESTPADQLPPDAPPVGMAKMLPASEVKKNLSKFTTMPANLLQIMADKLDLGLEIAQIDLGETAKPRYLEDGTLAIPETMKHVIVLAFEMDYDSIEAAPTTMGDIATMDGYSKMGITAGSLAQFIRKLGYNAIPCGNNTGVSVAQAVQAGLGEGGRNGILITPKYGPRVRLAKVITDLPMANDKPIRFGVEEFCKACKKCAEKCPTQAIPYGEKSFEPSTISSTPGLWKWSVNAEECYFGWTANGTGCGQCIRVCPFNKPEGWLHDATRILIGAKSGSLDKLMVNLDDASGYGGDQPKFDFWDKENYIHIKG